MYELIQLTDHDYYIDCPAKIGIVRIGAQEVIAIDSGSDKDAGRKVLRVLEQQGWQLSAIYNTHSHADHIGGNQFLQNRTGCRIYAPGLEAAFTNAPILEPMGLYGGYPFRELHHKFLCAQESRAEPLTPEALPQGMELLSLPGHSFDMVGFRTPDGTAYLADCVSSAETLEKYGIGYLWDVGASLATLEQLPALSAERFVPSHAPVCTDIAPLAQKNRDAIARTADEILRFCALPRSFEEILQQLFTVYGLTMTVQQYVLIGSTLRSYLAWLLDAGRVRYAFADSRMLWETVPAAEQ